MVTFNKSAYQTSTVPDQESTTTTTNTTTDTTESPRESGNAGQISVEDMNRTVDMNTSGRRIGTGSADLVTAPGYNAAENSTTLSKDEADALYEERIEDEYAKREGGA